MGNQIGLPPWADALGALEDLLHKLRKGKITKSELTLFLERKNPFETKQVEVASATSTIPDLDWVEVYSLLGLSEQFELFCQMNSKDLSTDPLTWAVPVIQGVTRNMVIAAFRKKGLAVSLCKAYLDDTDDSIRNPSHGSYITRFQKSVKVKERLAQRSDSLKRQRVKSITLLERLLLGLAYYLATGKHLDQENVTICAGPRGSVPRAKWIPPAALSSWW